MHTEKDFMKLAVDFRKSRPVLVALGDENRLHILYQMMCSMKLYGIRVGEIVERSSLSRPAVSHHLKVLKEAGIINVRREGTMNFDKHAVKYDEGFMGKGSSRFYIDLIKEMDVKDGDCVLDVGCGTGTVLNYVSKNRKIKGFGIDVSEAMRVLKLGGELYICDPRFPAVVRGLLNCMFKEAGFHNVKTNVKEFTTEGFMVENIVKDAYVQVLHFRKEAVC